MKCQILFSGKNKKNNIILSSAENAQRVVKVKQVAHCLRTDLFVNYNICSNIHYIHVQFHNFSFTVN